MQAGFCNDIICFGQSHRPEHPCRPCRHPAARATPKAPPAAVASSEPRPVPGQAGAAGHGCRRSLGSDVVRRPLPVPPKTHLPEDLPVLDTLPFFEAAARLGSFAEAGAELGVTAAAVAYRVKSLERHLGIPLFSRYLKGVRLNDHGRDYLDEVQQVLAELRQASDRVRGAERVAPLRLITVEVVSEKWLMPRLPDFRAAHPGVVIEFDTDQGAFTPEEREFDVWVAFTERLKGVRHCETLFEETLVPVCSPALVQARGRPSLPSDLHDWPLLFDLVWSPYWAHWFARHDTPPADLTRASGFRLYSVMVQAAVDGMGVALGHVAMIADELAKGALVPLFDSVVPAPARYVLCRAPDALGKPGVAAFCDWIRVQAANQPPAAALLEPGAAAPDKTP